MNMHEGSPQNSEAKAPALRQENPLLMAYIEEQIGEEAEKLLVREKGEKLNRESIPRIANYVAMQAEALGEKITRESLGTLLATKDIQDAIIKGTIVRLDTDLGATGK